MKKLIICVFCMAMVFSVASCESGNNAGAEDTVNIEQDNNDDTSVEIADPFVECANIEEAENLVGFSIDVPSIFDNLSDPVIRVDVEYKMIELIYNCDDDNQIRIRKAVSNEDISGDYTVYNEVESIFINDTEINISGNDGNINLITWKNDDYSHSISIDDNILSKDDVAKFIETIK